MAFGFVYGILAIVSSKKSAFKKGEDLKDTLNPWNYGGDEYASPNQYDDGFGAYSSNQKPAYGRGENIPMNNSTADQDYI